VTSAEVFDEYMGEGVPQGKKSLAIAVRFQSLDRTLTDADAAKEQERILRGLKHQFGAELRR
jgi:phenylalanyl-tRNA synthetase beta chain